MTESQIHVLVVDDERNIRNNLGMVPEAEGYKVDKCANGDDAIIHVKQGRYDIAFVDIQMPKMDGLELLRYLRELRPKMPLVILTAYGTVHRAVEAMKLGAVDFLEKPSTLRRFSFSAGRLAYPAGWSLIRTSGKNSPGISQRSQWIGFGWKRTSRLRLVLLQKRR